jgi:uncharacterized protein (DUF849 family)
MMVVLQACLNGSRTPDEFCGLPVSPAELAVEAAATIAAGARDVHLHPKDAAGLDCLEPDVVAAALRAVRAAVPGWVRVGVTTGAWAEPDPARRAALINSWPVLPDHASVNWHEDGAELVAAALASRGVGIEAGIWPGTDAAARFGRTSHSGHVIRVLAEVTDTDPETALQAAARLLDDISARWAGPVLLHGQDDSAWPVLRLAAKAGLDTRIGLEDVLRLPDGTIASRNADLITAALGILGNPKRN